MSFIDIERIIKEYYEKLYTSKATDASKQPLFINNNMKRLDIYESKLCEGLIEDIEAKKVLREMANNKTPGFDGYTAEFYKIFWKDIGCFVLRSLNYAYQHGQLADSQRLGVITLLPKGDKPRHLLKNWRPITLLGIDYKILSGVFALRLKKVLPLLIEPEQKGFQKGKFIGENTKLVYDIMNYLLEKKKPGLLLLVDFEKAFDSLERSLVLACLKKYNFGESFLKWVSTIYNKCSSTVTNNGWFSERFSVERGCRQGDPLSPYLFILAVEPLALSIKHCNKIKGIVAHGTEFTIGQYADDTFVLLDGGEKSLRETIKIFQVYEKCSGLKINVEKTNAVWLGSKTNDRPMCTDLRIKWVTEFTLLGIHFNTQMDKMHDSNYNKALGAMEKVFKVYSKRNLTTMGKVPVVNTLALPKLIHILSVLPNPSNSYMEKIRKMFVSFVWDNKTPKVARQALTKEKMSISLSPPFSAF